MSATTYPDGTPKVPRLGAMCSDPDPRHAVCGGWWCICDCHDDWELGEGGHVAEHVDHVWSQVGSCVYCDDCGVRLYQGQVALLEQKAAVAAVFDSVHEKISGDWSVMRAAVAEAKGIDR